MPRPTWIVLDSDHVIRPWFHSRKVYDPNPFAVSPAAKTHCDAPCGISTTFFAQGGGEHADGLAFVEVGVDGAAAVTNAGRDGFISFEFGDDGVVGSDGLASRACGIGTRGHDWRKGAQGGRRCRA